MDIHLAVMNILALPNNFQTTPRDEIAICFSEICESVCRNKMFLLELSKENSSH